MSVRDQDEWDPYLGDVLALMDHLPEGARVGGKIKSEVETYRTRLKTAFDGVDATDAASGFAHQALNGVITEINDWASKVLPSVTGEYGEDSAEARLTPRKTPQRHGGGTSGGGGATPVPQVPS
jgi:hypothetical protein